jgi:hypothetical protein
MDGETGNVVPDIVQTVGSEVIREEAKGAIQNDAPVLKIETREEAIKRWREQAEAMQAKLFGHREMRKPKNNPPKFKQFDDWANKMMLDLFGAEKLQKIREMPRIDEGEKVTSVLDEILSEEEDIEPVS